MSSLEIAELTGKLHRNVMADIRIMLEALGDRPLSFQHTVERPNPSGGRPIKSPCFHLPKRLVFNLVTGYSIPLRQKVIDRWMELEQVVAEAAPVPAPFAIPQTLFGGGGDTLQTQDISPIVHTSNGRVFATSKDVAAYFGKQHCNVLSSVDRMLEDNPDFSGLTGIFVEHTEARPGGGRPLRHFEMNRDGFVLLAMGFTGAKVLT